MENWVNTQKLKQKQVTIQNSKFVENKWCQSQLYLLAINLNHSIALVMLNCTGNDAVH